jgi:hypothetical protein
MALTGSRYFLINISVTQTTARNLGSPIFSHTSEYKHIPNVLGLLTSLTFRMDEDGITTTAADQDNGDVSGNDEED